MCKRYYYILSLTVLGLTACVTDEANRYYASEKYSPKAIGEVEILHGRPSKKFDVMAEFQSRGESNESFRKKSALIGADAVIIRNLGGYASLGSQWAGEDPYSGSHSRRVAIAIKYK